MRTRESDPTLTEDFESVAQEAEGLLNATGNQPADKVKELRARLAAALQSAKITAQRLEQKTVAAAKATDRCIRDHPYQTIGIAFGLGLLVGVLAARRKN